MRIFRTSLIGGAVLATVAFAPPAFGEGLRIGYISSLTHPVGREMVNGFRLGLAHVGWTENGDAISGVRTTVTWCHDQTRPEVAMTCVNRAISQEDVQLVAGIAWSNILMAVRPAVIGADRILMSHNAGPSPVAGKQCSRYFISTSWQGDQFAEAMGRLVEEEKLGSVLLLAPNYQAGRDVLTGFRRFYKKGTITREILFKLGETDFQSELTRIRAERPDAVFAFAPGPMAVALLKQWAASGLGDEVRLYTAYSVDHLSLPAIGEAAVGSYHTNIWGADLDNAVNRRFVKGFEAEHGRPPSNYAAQSYDGALLLRAALREAKGDMSDNLALMKAMRTVAFDSVRGQYRYNVNGFPIQDFYKREVVREDNGGASIRVAATVLEKQKDSYWEECPEAERM